MILQLTCKNCRISGKSREYVNKNLSKINKELKKIPHDEILLRFAVRKNIDKYYPAKKPYQKPALAVYEGSITFRLLKNRFYAKFKGATIEECAKTGFDRLFKEIGRFRNVHFPSESDYPDKRSIRTYING